MTTMTTMMMVMVPQCNQGVNCLEQLVLVNVFIPVTVLIFNLSLQLYRYYPSLVRGSWQGLKSICDILLIHRHSHNFILSPCPPRFWKFYNELKNQKPCNQLILKAG